MNITTVYKLTNQDLTTYGGYQYQVGLWHEFPGEGPLCTLGWSHAYEAPELAVLLNPVHANFDNPKLWYAEAVVGASDNHKIGCSRIRLLSEQPLPTYTVEQRVAWAIALAWQNSTQSWKDWARMWLAGKNRSASDAWWAAANAQAPSGAAVEGAAWAAAWAAGAAANADATEAAAGAAEAAVADEAAALLPYAKWALTLDTKIIEPLSWETKP